MSSTEDPFGRAARRFFDERLMEAGRRLAERGVAAVTPGPDPRLDSYYRRRTTTRMASEDLVVEGLGTEDGLADAMEEFWRRRGSAELAALAGDLERLAREARSLQEETEEVSPFIYVMF